MKSFAFSFYVHSFVCPFYVFMGLPSVSLSWGSKTQNSGCACPRTPYSACPRTPYSSLQRWVQRKASGYAAFGIL